GPFSVGDNAKIAAGAVVLKEIPSDATAVGVPARVTRVGGVKVEDLDQVNIPDPVAQELTRLEDRIRALEKALNDTQNNDAKEDDHEAL
ncbi:MAG: serine O-acetyltransferase, partial [Clostridia bacterium]|nr:serine O-acetyltransferase [Clostridia bacterium]